MVASRERRESIFDGLKVVVYAAERARLVPARHGLAKVELTADRRIIVASARNDQSAPFAEPPGALDQQSFQQAREKSDPVRDMALQKGAHGLRTDQRAWRGSTRRQIMARAQT